LRNWIALAALCAVATPAAAQDSDPAAQLEAAMSAPTSVADLLAAVEDCTIATAMAQAAGAAALEAKGWVSLIEEGFNLERSAPASLSLTYVRRNVSLSVTYLTGATACRIIAFLEPDADRASLTTGLQQGMGFAPLSRSSRFALRNPTISDDILAQMYETQANMIRVKFEPESAALGVNIVMGPNS
jgi:hypothetical protein